MVILIAVVLIQQMGDEDATMTLLVMVFESSLWRGC